MLMGTGKQKAGRESPELVRMGKEGALWATLNPQHLSQRSAETSDPRHRQVVLEWVDNQSKEQSLMGKEAIKCKVS